MPFHDWTRVDDETFHDLHGQWITHLTAHLNGGALPDGYFARGEARVFISRDAGDVADTPLERRPDVSVLDGGGQAVAVATAPPEAEARLDLAEVGEKWRRVAVYRQKDDALVGAVEIASHANLKSRDARRYLASKCRQLLAGGVGVCRLDAFPPAGRPRLEEFVANPEATEDDPPAVRDVRGPRDGLATSLQPGDSPAGGEAFFRPLVVGQPLPDAALFLSADAYVSLPLEKTYALAFAGIAPRDRATLQAT